VVQKNAFWIGQLRSGWEKQVQTSVTRKEGRMWQENEKDPWKGQMKMLGF
jgi:hypothetical protein